MKPFEVLADLGRMSPNDALLKALGAATVVLVIFAVRAGWLYLLEKIPVITPWVLTQLEWLKHALRPKR